MLLLRDLLRFPPEVSALCSIPALCAAARPPSALGDRAVRSGLDRGWKRAFP